jgi:hypothetical protein
MGAGQMYEVWKHPLFRLAVVVVLLGAALAFAFLIGAE